MNKPLVSCIMPTANRQKYIPFALDYFLNQDYPNTELIIIDDGIESNLKIIPKDNRIKYFYIEPIGTIGMKRNYACKKTSGEIIAHWDDDEWYAKDWISQQVNFLVNSEADMCGLDFVNYFSPITDTFWRGFAKNDYSKPQTWLNGPTIMYWRKVWEYHQYSDLQKGEDDDFIMNSGANLFAHSYLDGFVKILHPGNTTRKYFESPKHKYQKKL